MDIGIYLDPIVNFNDGKINDWAIAELLKVTLIKQTSTTKLIKTVHLKLLFCVNLLPTKAE